VTDEALLQLPKFPVLASLILRGTPASNAGLQPLGSMACLQQLDLGSKWELNDAGAPGAAGRGSRAAHGQQLCQPMQLVQLSWVVLCSMWLCQSMQPSSCACFFSIFWLSHWCLKVHEMW
jgi:hypothetical protein